MTTNAAYAAANTPTPWAHKPASDRFSTNTTTAAHHATTQATGDSATGNSATGNAAAAEELCSCRFRSLAFGWGGVSNTGLHPLAAGSVLGTLCGAALSFHAPGAFLAAGVGIGTGTGTGIMDKGMVGMGTNIGMSMDTGMATVMDMGMVTGLVGIRTRVCVWAWT